VLPRGVSPRRLAAFQSRLFRPPLPLYWLTGGLLLGQAAAPQTPGPGPAVVACLLAFLVRRPPAAVTALALLAAAVGHLQVDRLLHPRLPVDHVRHYAGSTVEIRGRVVARTARPHGRARLLIEAAEIRRGSDWRRTIGRVLISLRRAERPWRRGDRAQGILRLRAPRNFGNPGEFDYEAFLARRRVYATGFAADDRRWKRTPGDEPWPIRLLAAWRASVSRAIERNVDPPQASVLAALLLGESGALAPEVRDRYARAGVSHVLAISGLHVGMVAGAGYAGARWLLARSEWLLLTANVPKLAMGLGALPVLLYAAIAGGSTATARAVMMVLLVMLATLVDRQRDWLAGLAAAAAGISLLWPGSIFEVSFQLSFAAVLALVLGMRRVAKWWNDWEERRLVRLRGPRWRVLRWFVLYNAVTVCALAGTAPLAVRHFNRISLVGIAANAVAVPLLGLLPVGIGLLGVVAVPVAPPLGGFLLRLAGTVVAAADRVVAGLAALPFAAVRVVTPTGLEIALAYGLLAVLLAGGRHRRVLLATALVLVGADAGYWWARRFHRTVLRVTFLSVGQGASTIVEFPGSHVMVVDGGGLSASFDVGERLLAPFLWRRKIAHVDTLVLSHPDFDHFGGLDFLVKAFSPGALWWNGAPGHGVSFEGFWSDVRARGPPPALVARGLHGDIGGVDVRVLHPRRATGGSDNDRSLVLQLRYGPVSLLLPGDLEAEGEHELIVAERAGLASTILAVPHHGSRTSSTPAFVGAVSPHMAIISCGYHNRFGMPHARVLEEYRRRGIEVRRTDLDGALLLTIDAAGHVSIELGHPRAPRRRSTLDTSARRSLKRGVN
jgi:competence protein ComEC